MKLSEIKVGEIYGALDNPSGRRSGNVTPRPVKVLEIVVKEHTQRNHYTSVEVPVKKKYLLVQATTHPHPDGHRYPLGVDKLKKDETCTIESRNLVGLWSEMRDGILEKIAEFNQKQAAREATKARIVALGFDYNDYRYSQSGLGWGPELRFTGAEAVEQVLALLEQSVRANTPSRSRHEQSS